MTDNRKKLTFAQVAILKRIAQKEAMNPKSPTKFQDYTEHTDYEAYTDAYGDSNAAWLDGQPVADTGDYGDSHSGWLPGGCDEHADYSEAWHMMVDANGVPCGDDNDYCEAHGDYCDFATVPPSPSKPTLWQRIFGKRR